MKPTKNEKTFLQRYSREAAKPSLPVKSSLKSIHRTHCTMLCPYLRVVYLLHKCLATSNRQYFVIVFDEFSPVVNKLRLGLVKIDQVRTKIIYFLLISKFATWTNTFLS